jgi:hypothetical protein
MTTLVVLGALVFLPLAFIVPAVLWKWRESREQARLAEARRERQEAAERRFYGTPASAARSPEAEEVWKEQREQRAFRAAFAFGSAEPVDVAAYHRMRREQDPSYDSRREEPDLPECTSSCCAFGLPNIFWV